MVEYDVANVVTRVRFPVRALKMEKITEKEFERYIPHTSCARIALFGNYKNLDCDPCRKFYGTQELKKQEEWFTSLGRTTPKDIEAACFDRI